MATQSDRDDAPTQWPLSLLLMGLTFLSMLFASAPALDGATAFYERDLLHPSALAFAVPLMTILLSHELGHYIAARRHRVPVSPPYFIPMPIVMLGTFGAVIHMPGRIKTRNALLDVGAAGPLAGLAVCLPVLAYGIAQSPVQPLPDGPYFVEGRSLLYTALLYLLKGPIPEGHDIMLSPTAFAGWAGLLVTMINLIPVGQLDGGHVAYALLGPPQNRYSEKVRRALPGLAAAVGTYFALQSFIHGQDQDRIFSDLFAGLPWLVWALLLRGMTRMAGPGHPATDDDVLSPRRRLIARLTLLLIPLLFMPYWMLER